MRHIYDIASPDVDFGERGVVPDGSFGGGGSVRSTICEGLGGGSVCCRGRRGKGDGNDMLEASQADRIHDFSIEEIDEHGFELDKSGMGVE